MKYIIALLFSLIIASPALAARQVPGNLPQNQPLEPIPEDTSPNISRNVQAAPQDQQANPAADQNVPSSASSVSQPAAAPQLANLTSGSASPALKIFFSLLALAIGAVLLALFSRRNRKL